MLLSICLLQSEDIHCNVWVTAITFLIIGISVFTLVLSQSFTAMAQQEPTGNSFQMDNMTFSHHSTSVNGIQLHYVIGGNGEPIVLLHGWPQTWYEWRHIMPSLAKNYTVIAPDLRGLGDSSKPVTGYDGKTTAEDIYQLVSQLGFNKIFLVGHDFGAQVAYSYAAAHPNDVSHLVILDVPIPGIGPGQNINGLMVGSISYGSGRTRNACYGHEREYLTSFYRHTCNPEAITQDDIDEYVSHYSAPGGMRAGFEYYRALLDDVKQEEDELLVDVILSTTKLSF